VEETLELDDSASLALGGTKVLVDEGAPNEDDEVEGAPKAGAGVVVEPNESAPKAGISAGLVAVKEFDEDEEGAPNVEEAKAVAGAGAPNPDEVEVVEEPPKTDEVDEGAPNADEADDVASPNPDVVPNADDVDALEAPNPDEVAPNADEADDLEAPKPDDVDDPPKDGAESARLPDPNDGTEPERLPEPNESPPVLALPKAGAEVVAVVEPKPMHPPKAEVVDPTADVDVKAPPVAMAGL
jgi:hypothetical protein